ncbi:MAG: response regulator [Anaerolineae bacterium]|nr:response regulator [Anaerolineae bacterium]
MAGARSDRVRQIGLVNQREIRERTVRGLAACLGGASLLWWWELLFQQRPNLVLLAIATSSALLGGLGFRFGARRPLSVGLALAVASAAALPVLAGELEWQAVAPLAVMPGLVVAGTVSAGAGLAVGAVAAVVLGFWPSGGGMGAGAALQVATVGLALYAVLRPRESIIEWSWQRSAEATYLAEELRDRQGELNNALAQLRLAYQLLGRTNRELALAQQEADEARRLKEEFAASVSHELRTPLNIILGFADIIHRTPEVYGLEEWPQMLRRDVAEIWRSARYITELVDDILELARIDALEMPVKREMTDLVAVIRETCVLAERLLGERPVSLVVRLPENLPLLSVDRTRIRQVLLNLLSNAIRFTDEGEITVTAECSAEEVTVSVADTGVGIPPHEVEAVFEEFRHAEGREARGGKGLGLAVAKRFVNLHGGRIWAESEVGQGSVFRFTLPLSEKRVSRLRGTTASAPRGTRSGKLLLFNPDLSEDAATYLGRHLEGWETLVASDVNEMQALLDTHHPAAVLINCAPDGAELASRVPAGVPVVLLDLPALRTPSHDSVFDALLSKPVSAEELLGAVRRFVPRGSILVVDDDPGFVQLVRRMVASSDAPYEVQWAYNGEGALSKLAHSRPDVVLMDMVMQPMDGMALARQIRAEAGMGEIPIVAVTGATSTASSDRAREIRLLKRSGLQDAEVLAVLRAILGGVRSDYVGGTQEANEVVRESDRQG